MMNEWKEFDRNINLKRIGQTYIYVYRDIYGFEINLNTTTTTTITTTITFLLMSISMQKKT